MSRLDFEFIKFYGIDSMEPAFSPEVREYTIRRKAGTEMSFVATLNLPPAPQDPNGGWFQPQYPGYSLEYHIAGNDTKDFWTNGQNVSVSCGVGERKLSIYCQKSKKNHDVNAQTVGLEFNVITEPMSEEEIKACTHRRTHSYEGECWGGGSGSCSVEIITVCDDCGETVGKSFDYRS